MRRFLPCLVLLVGCYANDPVYMPGPTNLEGGVDDGTGVLSEAKASLQIPINTETADDAKKRMAREAELNASRATPLTLPYVKLGDIEIEVEWTIKNLDPDNEGLAFVELNGGNERFFYDPSVIVLSDDPEAPPAPPLQGNMPIHVAAGDTLNGKFVEDDLREASIDIVQMSEAGMNPYKATLTVSKNVTEIQPVTPYDPTMPDAMQVAVGDPIPREAMASIVRVDLVFRPDRHMVLDYTVRVRDVRGILNDKLLDADPAQLAQFAPAMYAP
jgi:hypothetical protein